MLALQNGTGNRFVFQSSDMINQGGEGAIYEVASQPDFVAKIYHPTIRDPSKDSSQERTRAAGIAETRFLKLRAMLANPPRADSNRGHVAIAWPTDLLFDPATKMFRGFLMKKVPKSRQLAAFTVPSSRTPDLRHLGNRHAHTTASNVALVVDALHRANYVIGDVSGGNVLAASNGFVSIVDTDSFQVWDPVAKRMFRCPVGTADFTPPELQGANFREVDRRPEHDLFGLAVLLFQLLMSGEHPFDGATSDEAYGAWDRAERIKRRTNFPYGPEQVPFRRRPAAPPLASLDQELQELFLVCFIHGMHDPKKRPSAKTWQAALTRSTARMKDCSANNVHAYSNHLSRCPYCEVEAQVRSRAQTKLQKPASNLLSIINARIGSAPGSGLANYTPWRSQNLFSRPVFPAPPTPPPPPPPPPPRPLIVAGKWQLVAAGPDPRAEMAAAIAPIIVDLESDWTVTGSLKVNMGALAAPELNVSMNIYGNWHHDPANQTFSWRYVMTPNPMIIFGIQVPLNIPPQSVSQSFRVAMAPDGSLTGTEAAGGQFKFIKL